MGAANSTFVNDSPEKVVVTTYNTINATYHSRYTAHPGERKKVFAAPDFFGLKVVVQFEDEEPSGTYHCPNGSTVNCSDVLPNHALTIENKSTTDQLFMVTDRLGHNTTAHVRVNDTIQLTNLLRGGTTVSCVQDGSANFIFRTHSNATVTFDGVNFALAPEPQYYRTE